MKKMLSIILTVALLCTNICALAQNAPFDDVPENHWAYDEILYFYNTKVINGIDENTFAPDEYVTREQFAKILAITFNKTDTIAESQTFSDVTPDMWSYNYIEAVKEYLTGYYPNGTTPFFNPSAKAAREDIAYALVKINNMYNGEYDEAELSKFSDYSDVSLGLRPYVAAAVEQGLIKGYTDGTLKPQDGITRAEAVTLLFRAIKQPVSSAVPEPTAELTSTAEPTTKPTAEPTAKPTATPATVEDGYNYIETKNVVQISGYKDGMVKGTVTMKWSPEKDDAKFYADLRCNNGGLADYVDCTIELTELLSCTDDKLEGYFTVTRNTRVDEEIRGTVTLKGGRLTLNTTEYDYNLIAVYGEDEDTSEKVEEAVINTKFFSAEVIAINSAEATGLFSLEYEIEGNVAKADINAEKDGKKYVIQLVEPSAITKMEITGSFVIACDGETVVERIKGKITGLDEDLEGNLKFVTDDGEWTVDTYIVEIGM